MVIFNALLNLRELKELYSGKPVCVCPLYKGSIGILKRFETSGNPVVLPEYKSLEKLNIKFSPKQAGSGDPSPENVRAISGYDEITVNVRGKNLWTSDISYPVAQNHLNYDEDTETYTLFPGLPTWSESIFSLPTHIPPATQVTCSVFFESGRITGNISIGGYHYNPNSWQGMVEFPLNQDLSGKTVTNTMVTKDTVTDFWVFLNDGCEVLEETKFKVMYVIGKNSGNWEPYQPGTTATLTFPETIYGGTVDAVTGIGEKTWGYIASYNGETLPGEWISDRDVYAPGTTPTTGAQVAYKLATPESFKVSQVSIPSLRGENTFFTNGENMDIIYKKESFWSDEV